LSDEELKSFRLDLQRDPELIEELDLHRTIDEGIRNRDELEFRKKLDDSYKVYRSKQEERKRLAGRKKIMIRITAAIAAVLVVALFFIVDSSPITKDSIFEEYYAIMEFDFTSRSVNEDNVDPNLISGIRSYIDHDFQLSKLRLQEYINAGSGNDQTAIFFLGLCQIELGNYPDAEFNFKRVAEGEFSYYREHSKWYLALTYLKMNHLDEAESIFREFAREKSVYNSKSTSILKKILKIK
jgi:tetratricopeptide (TPR) repeat protein